MSGRFNDVGTDAFAMVLATVHIDFDANFTLSILTFRNAADVKFFQPSREFNDAFHGFEDCINRAVPNCRIATNRKAFALKLQCGGRNCRRSSRCMEADQSPAIRGIGQTILDQRNNVGVVYFLLLVSQSNKVVERFLQCLILEVES